MDSTQASAELRELVLDAAHDLKAVDVVALEVSDMTDITDTMIVAGGTSDRHVKAIVDNVLAVLKGAGKEVLGVEGRDVGGWVLLDLGDVVLHVMRAEARSFYDLERLWENLDATMDAPATTASNDGRETA
ncbi:MAG: ribosome silencing factor [Gammaproteobacteria bacterium]|nr:ribosome silencing factor [Gammaproteobacteria bacterium]MXY52984.1 ribosome silencing factor [Gammaproteobacteria bacterium]